MAISDQTMSSRLEELRDLARAELEAFTLWLNEPEDEETGDADPPDSRYWQPLEDWLKSYTPSILPIAQREMKALDEAYQRFNETGNSMPVQEFWQARDAAQKACMKVAPELKPRKTPAELVADKVPLRQIAYEWRLLIVQGDGNKLPDIAAVQRELDKPGSVLTPEYIEADNQWRLAEMGFVCREAVQESWHAESVSEDEPQMPALLELIDQRASVSQIAKLLNNWRSNGIEVWEAAVRATATAMRIHLPANATEGVNEAGRDLVEHESGKAYADRPIGSKPVMEETEVERAVSETVQKPSDIEAEILAKFQGGQDVGSIASEMAMPPKKVQKIIRTWEGRV